MNLSRPDMEENEPDFNIKDVTIVSEPDRECDEDFVDMKRLSVQDKGWISPPDSIYSSSLECDELSAKDIEKNVGGLFLMEQHSDGHDIREANNVMRSVSFTQYSIPENMQSESLVKSSGKDILEEEQLETRVSPSHSLGSEKIEVKVVETPLSNEDKVEGHINQSPLPNMDVIRITRGKNRIIS